MPTDHKTIKFEQTPDDFAQFTRFMHDEFVRRANSEFDRRIDPPSRRTRFAVGGGLTVALVTFILQLTITPSAWPGALLLGGLFGGGTCIFILLDLGRGRARQRYAELDAERSIASFRSPALGTIELSLNETGIVQRTNTGAEQARWESIQIVDSTDDHVFIVTSPSSAFFIPRKSIISGDCDGFLLEVETGRNNYQKPGVGPRRPEFYR